MSRKFLVLTLLLGALAAVLILGLNLGKLTQPTQRPLMDRAPTAAPLRPATEAHIAVAAGQTIYVPVYSHIYTGYGRETGLEVTLSIRNTDLHRPIAITAVCYYDNEGSLLRQYLQTPALLAPLASTDFLVEERDMAGGVGANFLVEWVTEGTVSAPIVEAVMVHSVGNRAFAFARPGYTLPSSTEATEKLGSGCRIPSQL